MKKPPEGGGNGSVGNSRLDRICVRLPSNHSAGLDCGPGLSLRSRAVCLAGVNRSRRPTKPEHMTATLDDEEAALLGANRAHRVSGTGGPNPFPSSEEMLWGGRRDFLPRSQEVKRRDGNPNAIVCPLRRERWIRQLMAHLA